MVKNNTITTLMLYSFKLKTFMEAGLATKAGFPFQTCCEIKRFHRLLPVDISVTKVDSFYFFK